MPLSVRLAALALSLTVLACGAELPIVDVCEAGDNATTNPLCTPCTADADCVIGGNPCCHDSLKWSCLHDDDVEDFDVCEATCSLAPPRPDDARCACVDARCQAR